MSYDKVRVVSPVGVLMHVNIAGQGKLNYNKDGREYVGTVRLSGKEAQDLKAQIDKVYDDEHSAKFTERSRGYRVVKDESGKETGEIDFNYKTQTTFQDGSKKEIKVYNKNAQQVSLNGKRIGNGSLGAISGMAQYYINGKEDGVSLWLNSIQLVKFTEYVDNGGFGKADGDFDGVEDSDTGFTGQPDDAAEEQPTQSAKPRL